MPNNIVVFDEGKLFLMKLLIKGGLPALDGHVTFHLFSNSSSLNETYVLTDLTEIIMPGYDPAVLSGALDEGIDANLADTWQWPILDETCTAPLGSPVIAFGYYVTYNTGDVLLWGQVFDVPAVWEIPGDSYSFQPQFSLGTCFVTTIPGPFELFAVDGLIVHRHYLEMDIDASLLVSITEGFDIDTDIFGEAEVFFQVDSELSVPGERTFIVTAVVQEIVETSFTFDAALGATFHVDAVLANRLTHSFSVDSLIEFESSRSFTADSQIASTGRVYFQANGLLAARPMKTFSADAVIAAISTVAMAVDAQVERVNTVSFSVDANIELESQLNFQVEAVISSQSTVATAVDAMIEIRRTTSFTADTAVAASHTISFTADADLKKTLTRTFTVDAQLASTHSLTFSADAEIASRNSVAFSADALVAAAPSPFFSVRSVVSAVNNQTFTVAADVLTTAPTVTAVAPGQGSTNGGTTVTLTGTMLSQITAVNFGATVGTINSIINNTQAKVVSPAHASGTVNITVTNTGGTSPTAGGNAFSYYYLLDTFLDVNGTLVSAHTPNIGGSYTVTATSGSASNFIISSNLATINTSTLTDCIAVTNSPAANHNNFIFFQATNVSGCQVYAVVRWANASNYTYAQVDGKNLQLKVIQVVSGTPTTLQTTAITAFTVGVTYTLQLQTSATALKAVLSGSGYTTVAPAAITNSVGAANLGNGFGTKRDDTNGFFQANLFEFFVT